MIKKLIVMYIILVASTHFSFGQEHQTRKPNIIFILVDDQGYGDVGVFWQNQRAKRGLPYERSPCLDELAVHGAMLTQHYAAAPVCAPSRASIMEGVSQGHARVRDNQFDKAIANNYTMASTLRELGYRTAAIGKWGLEGDKRWDKNGAGWPARPDKRGFDYFFGYMRHGDGHQHYPKEGIYTGKKQVLFNGKNMTPELDKCYTADLWTAAAKHWIVEHEKKNKDQPFFMYLAYDTPHAVDELPTQKYPAGGGLQGGIQWIGKPGHFINTASGEIDSYINPDYAHATYDSDHNSTTPEVPWPETYKRYAMANRRIDYAVGDIVQLLKDLHIDSTTMIVYTSDNGPSIETYLGKWQREEAYQLPTFFGSYGPFDGIKRDCWEGGEREPTIGVWPGHIPEGEVVKKPSISYDWAPTFIDAAGATPPERMDGVSLLPSLTGKGSQITPLLYIEYYQHGRTPGFKQFSPNHRGRIRDQMQWMRIGNYVGVRYNIKSSNDSFEIYNVVKDPQETVNLALTPHKKVKIKERESFNTNTLNKISINELGKYMKARVLQVRRPDTSYMATERGTSHRPYDSTLVPSVKVKVVSGITWREYAGSYPWIPQVATLTPVVSGYAANPDAHIDKQNNNSILFFEGYIKAPQNGLYTFYLTTGSKAFMRLHDVQLIDEDFGYTGGSEKEGSIFLKAGLHPFRLYYKKDVSVNPLLNLEWSGPGISKQKITSNYFFRNKKVKLN